MYCDSCLDRVCERGTPETLDQCKYGIPYIRRRNGEIDRLDERMPLRSLADNLRHELHQFLQLIVNNACEIDGAVSTAWLDINSPASRIVTATVLINNFVEVISGVNNFDPPRNAFKGVATEPIKSYFERAVSAYSLLQTAHRCNDLQFCNEIDNNLRVQVASKAFEYIAFVLVDNCYKYAKDATPVLISSSQQLDGKYLISISNYSDYIMNIEKAFERGYQARHSEGYGYGLFWIRRLLGYMNEQLNADMSVYAVAHEGEGLADFRYSFEITGVPCG